MGHRVIYGGGAALAQPLIAKWLADGHRVTAVCRSKRPIYRHDNLCVFREPEYAVDVDPVDVLVTLSGSTADRTVVKMADEAWDKVLESCLTSVFRALRMTLPRMANGNVVIVGSIAASLGPYGCANYAAAKAGLEGLVRSAATEQKKRGNCINLLELGYMETGMGARLDPDLRNATIDLIPLKRFGTEADFIQAVDFMAQTRYMTGNVLTLAGGMR